MEHINKNDWILIGVILLIALVSSIGVTIYSSNNEETDGVATVYYNSDSILEISLVDGSYQIIDDSRVVSIDEENHIYHVLGSNSYGVYIQYEDNKVAVIDEESPKNICQYQGATNSSLYPLTCLPNNIVIVIEQSDSVEDVRTG